MNKRHSVFFLTLLLFTCHFSLVSAQTPNARQAREIFDKVWKSAFGPQGATFHYKVNIIGIYKTEAKREEKPISVGNDQNVERR